MKRIRSQKKQNQTHRQWKKNLVVILAALVVFTTTYALILPAITIDEEAAKKWLANGAQPIETVAKLLKSAGIEK